MNYNLEKPNMRQFVYSLYLGLLGRAPDDAGLANHVKRLTTGETTEADLAAEFLKSSEYGAKRNIMSGFEGHTNIMSDFGGYTGEDLKIFSKFDRSKVKPSEGFLTEWIGSRVRISMLWSEMKPEQFNNRIMPLPVPCDYHSDAIEWIGTLKAVLAAQGSFSVMELGAGHGPWLAASCAAARSKGISDFHLCGIEADPGRFELLAQNMTDNQLENVDTTLVEGGIGTAEGVAHWPRLPNPKEDAGARPFREGNQKDKEYLANRLDDLIEVKIIALGPLVKKRPIWDLIHIDIQGTEHELCQGYIKDLSDRARYLVIATHTRKIEGDLIDLFLNAGWHLEHEKPSRLSLPFTTQASSNQIFTDGTQVWRNPRL